MILFLLRKLIVLAVLFSFFNNANAVNVNYSVEGGVGYSDNITRVETNKLNDSIRSVRGILNVVDESSTNDFTLDMDLAYLDYREDTFDDDVIANIALASKFSIMNEALTWTVDGAYGQQAINAFTVRTPNNLQDTGLFSTGPNLVLNFTSLDSLTLKYRYSDFYAEQTLTDYQNNRFSTLLSRRISPIHTFTLNASYDDLKYEDDSNVDFERFIYSVLVGGASTTTQYSFEWGVINIEFENGVDSDNDLKRFSFSRQMNKYNNISLQLSETIENGARASNNIIPGDVNTGLFVNDMALVSYSYNRDDFQISLGSTYSEQDYVVQNNLDRKIFSTTLGLVYGTPFNLQTTLSFKHVTRDFHDVIQTDDEDTIILSFERRLTQDMNIVGTYINFTRDTNDNIQMKSIDENRFTITLRFLGRI